MKIQPLKTQSHIYHPITDLRTLAAWQGQLAEVAHDPQLRQQLAQRESTFFPPFAVHYQRLTSLPRRVRRSLQRQWKRSLAGMALLLALSQGPAHAGTTIHVPAGDVAALIQAIENANSETGAFVGADTIVLPENSTFTLTAANNTTYNPTGLPVITSEITIQGNGSTLARSTAKGTPRFRLLAIASGGSLTLQQTTITGGKLPPTSTYGNSSADTDAHGGGIANYGGALTLSHSTISGNGDLLTVTGGGVFNNRDGSLTLTHSTVSGNAALVGGGVLNRGTLTLNNSTVSNNGTIIDGYGGGILNYGDTTLTHSTVSGNYASLGGGISNRGGTLTLTNSTISGNYAGFRAAGIANYGGSLTLTHSTVSGNSVSYTLGTSMGGGLYNGNFASPNSSTVTLSHTLISGNAAPYGAEVSNFDTITGSNYNLLGHDGLTNAHAFFGFTPGPTDITATSDGTIPTALGAILQVDNTGTPVLQDNGGPTQTIALVKGSPAIDAVTDGSCPPPATDQRGFTRPADGNGDGTTECDSGAFEFGATAAFSVTIDVKPGSGINPINPHSRGIIPVALLSTQTTPGEALNFDATQVDPGTLAFGPNGASVMRSALRDVDGDGDPDLLLHFRTQETGIACGNTAVTLTGKTFDGQAITGTDSIETVRCKKGKP